MSDIIGEACAIIVAAGRSERMAGADKIFAELMGRPLIAWTLGAFHGCDAIDQIVVVTSEDSIERMSDLVVEWRFERKVIATVAGGATRQQSVLAGLRAASKASIVAIHDGARPLVTTPIIEAGIALSRTSRAALCAVPARDTVKEVAGEPPIVQSTPDRSAMWLAQTPQCFERGLLMRAHEEAARDMTDDAAFVEAIGHAVAVYEGSWSNIKVTTRDDLTVAEALLRKRFAEM